MANYTGTPSAYKTNSNPSWTTTNVDSFRKDMGSTGWIAYKTDIASSETYLSAAAITVRLPSSSNTTMRVKCLLYYERFGSDYPIQEISETVTVTAPGTDHTFTFTGLPATISGTVCFKFSAVSGSVSVTSPSVNITASAPPTPTAPTLNAPKNTTVDGDTEIVFSWSLASGAYLDVLQYSTDQNTWIALDLTYTSSTTGKAAASSLPQGTVYWRARSVNEWGGLSGWSTASFTVAYAATTQVVPVNTPTSGAISTQTARTFQVRLEVVGSQSVSFTIASATLFWRAGTSGSWTELSMTASGDSASKTVAAGTFSQGTIQWKASATDNTGHTTETEVYTLTAINASIVAIPQSPINTLESGTSPITLRWRSVSLDGSAQSAAQLQRSSNGVDWVSLNASPGSATSWTAPAGTFPGGTVYWRVRAKTSTTDWGPWSDAVSFIAFSATTVEGVTADGKPFCTITWQTSGQVAYEVEVDGQIYGPYLDPDARSYTLTEPLSDGIHVFRVRVQNRFSLWSEWAEGNASVVNQRGSSVLMMIATGLDVIVAISASNPAAGPFLIYRNGKLIGKTTNNMFFDKPAMGACTYRVLQLLAGGYYTEATGNGYAFVDIKHPCISALAGGDWIELRLSENQSRTQTVTRSRQTASVYYAGARYPSVEIGRQESLSATGDAAFMYSEEEQAAAFEALVGRPVIYKTPGGAMVVGVLEALPRTDKEFYRAYTFTVKQMHWRDFVDES